MSRLFDDLKETVKEWTTVAVEKAEEVGTKVDVASKIKLYRPENKEALAFIVQALDISKLDQKEEQKKKRTGKEKKQQEREKKKKK